MLGKLIKHEFRATARIMLPLIGALLAVSILANLSMRQVGSPNAGQSSVLNILSTIALILFGVGIMAVFIMSIVLMVQRFRSNLLQDEGYIMFTLPVTAHGLIWSKIIVSAVWFLATIAAIAAAGVTSVLRMRYIRDLIDAIRQALPRLTASQAVDGTAAVIEMVLIIIFAAAVMCLIFYAALSTGHGFANHKMLLSVISFIVYTVAMELISSLIANLFTSMGWSLPFYNTLGPSGRFHLTCGYLMFFMAIYGAVFYVITAVNLKRRLNLE